MKQLLQVFSNIVLFPFKLVALPIQKNADRFIVKRLQVDVSLSTISVDDWKAKIERVKNNTGAHAQLLQIRRRLLNLNEEADAPNLDTLVRDANALVIGQLLSELDVLIKQKKPKGGRHFYLWRPN